MKRFLISVFFVLASGFGFASQAQAQILYGYSAPDYSNGGYSGSMVSGGYNAGNTLYYPWNSGMSGSSYGGGGSSPYVSAYVPIYAPMGPNYQLSPVSRYSSTMSGMSGGVGMTPAYGSMMSPGMSPLYGGGMGPFWMRRR